MHNTSYCLIEVVTKAGLTVFSLFSGEKKTKTGEKTSFFEG
jgi:hypothetical protein